MNLSRAVAEQVALAVPAAAKAMASLQTFWFALRQLRLSACLVICLALFSLKSHGMAFSLQERCYPELSPSCQTMVLAEGTINKQTPAVFKKFSQQLPAGTWIAFTSPGGSLVGGMQLGVLIREQGFNTTLGSTDYSATSCLSACAYAFLGGLSRFIPPNGRYGLHQFRGSEKELGAADTQKLSAILAKYIDAMGVDRRLLDIAQLTAADRVALLTPAQTKLYRIDNLGQAALPRWRLEAAPEGKLLALNNGIALGSKLPMVVAFVQGSQAITCLIFYRTEDAAAFTKPTPHRLIINQISYTLTPSSNWQVKKGGYQASFSVPSNAVQALSQLPETALIQFQGDFETMPNGLESINLRLGVAGLKNALAAIGQRVTTP